MTKIKGSGKAISGDVKKAFDVFLDEEIVNYGLKSLEKIYPSRFGGCPRKLYYDYYEPKDFKTSTKRNFWFGKLIHSSLEEIYVEQYPDCRIEEFYDLSFQFPFKDKIVSGRPDMVFSNDVPVEIKTTKSFKGIPYDSAKAQLMAYMNYYNSDVGKLIYFHKVYHYPKEIKIEMDADFLESYLEDMYTHLVTVANKEQPRRVNSDESWQCNYCQYKTVCK